MEDAHYDKLKIELKMLNPGDSRLTQIGSPISDRNSILQKKSHTIPMGSQNKVTNLSEWQAWIKNNLIKNGISSTEKLFASYKMDGGSISLQYKNGKLIEAISRGDGMSGEDLSANAMSFKGLPTSIKTNFSGFVRGEIILNMDDWDKIDPDKTSNPRNMAVGIARRKDGFQSEYLTFYAFKMFSSSGDISVSTEEEMYKQLKGCGFNTVETFIGTFDEVWNWYNKVAKIRSSLNYWIDGIVAVINDIDKQLQLGESSNCPKSSIAIKFEAERGKSTLLNVKFEVGHSGALTPVAQFAPCFIGGTTVEFASLYNPDNIENLGLCIGDEIEVIKANDIIPCITEVLKKATNRCHILIPTKCPVCNGKVEKKSNISGLNSVNIYCINKNCSSQVTGRISKYVKSLDIQGIGNNLIEAMVSQLNIIDASDLYILKKRKTELANLILSGKVRFGEKRTDKFLEEIEKKRKLPLNNFLGSLGIAGLGKRRVSLIQEALTGKMDKLEDWFADTLVKNADQSTLPNAAYNIHEEIINQKDNIMKYIKNGVEIVEDTKVKIKTGALLFCLTGKFSQPKEHFHNLIEKFGHSWTPTYTKAVDYLVTADPFSTSSKMDKAKKNGTQIVDEKYLLDLLK